MIPSRIGLKHSSRASVPIAYKEMDINTDHDIDSISNEHDNHPPSTLVHNYINNLPVTFSSSFNSQQQRKRASQTTMFDYLPPQFQDRYGTPEEEILNDEWGESYKY